jgi:hypothetical protein
MAGYRPRRAMWVRIERKYPWERPSAIKKRTHASHPSILYNQLTIEPTGKSVEVFGLLNLILSGFLDTLYVQSAFYSLDHKKIKQFPDQKDIRNNIFIHNNFKFLLPYIKYLPWA